MCVRICVNVCRDVGGIHAYVGISLLGADVRYDSVPLQTEVRCTKQ
jgi:hypothetical protein